MAAESADKTERDRRAYARYHVDLKAVAVRRRNRLLPLVPGTVAVTIKDISQVAVRWHSKEIFYRGELVGLNLEAGEGEASLRCVVRVFRTRRISGQYEVVGFFVKVAQGDEAPPLSPEEATADATADT
jgi:hypothetical protein